MRTQEFKAGQQNAFSVFQVAMQAPDCSPQEKIEIAGAMLERGICFEVVGSWLDRYVRETKVKRGTNPEESLAKAPPTKASRNVLNSVQDDYARFRKDHGLSKEAQTEAEPVTQQTLHPGQFSGKILKAQR